MQPSSSGVDSLPVQGPSGDTFSEDELPLWVVMDDIQTRMTAEGRHMMNISDDDATSETSGEALNSIRAATSETAATASGQNADVHPPSLGGGSSDHGDDSDDTNTTRIPPGQEYHPTIMKINQYAPALLTEDYGDCLGCQMRSVVLKPALSPYDGQGDRRFGFLADWGQSDDIVWCDQATHSLHPMLRRVNMIFARFCQTRNMSLCISTDYPVHRHCLSLRWSLELLGRPKLVIAGFNQKRFHIKACAELVFRMNGTVIFERLRHVMRDEGLESF